MLKLLPLVAMLIFASPAEAHQRHHRHNYYSGVWVWSPHHSHHTRIRQPRIRINEHCIYKPWKNKVICRY